MTGLYFFYNVLPVFWHLAPCWSKSWEWKVSGRFYNHWFDKHASVLIHIHISYSQNNNSSVLLFSMHFACFCLCYHCMHGNIPLKHEYGIWNLLVGMNNHSIEVWWLLFCLLFHCFIDIFKDFCMIYTYQNSYCVFLDLIFVLFLKIPKTFKVNKWEQFFTEFVYFFKTKPVCCITDFIEVFWCLEASVSLFRHVSCLVMKCSAVR